MKSAKKISVVVPSKKESEKKERERVSETEPELIPVAVEEHEEKVELLQPGTRATKVVKPSRKPKVLSLDVIPDNANKSTILQSISSVLEAKGISHEAGKHQDVINISEGYKKKIYISRPATKPSAHCYFCRQLIEHTPIGNPIRMEQKKYIVEGVFCSFNCLLAYHQEQNNIRYRECGIHINMIFRELYGKRMTLVPSKSWKLLKEYGGELSVKDWKKLSEPFVELKEEESEKYKDMVNYSSEMFIGD